VRKSEFDGWLASTAIAAAVLLRVLRELGSIPERLRTGSA